MANVKQILVVDDHFEMLEFLRSMLEMSGYDYEVLAVPSAEEGLLELHRTNFDLMITDVRLPGMSGFELVRRVRRVRPNMAVIILTAYSSAQGKQEAEELKVDRYFAKPIDTEMMLTAVNTLLYGDADKATTKKGAGSGLATNPVSTRVQQRLESLRTDTGATGLALARMDGTILHEIGNQRVPIDLDNLVSVVAQNIENGFGLAQALGGEAPFTIQYHAGDAYELYNANIGRHFFITMYFDIRARRGRIGTIWVFTQRAIKELFALLVDKEDRSQAKQAEPQAKEQPPAVKAPAQPARPPARPKPEPSPAPAEEIDYDAERNLIDKIPSWSELEWTGEEEEADLNDLLLALNLDEEVVTAVDLDSFWEEALNDRPKPQPTGLSYEDAVRQGLIAPNNGDE
jgi:DNA-binding response OmpR family regulator